MDDGITRTLDVHRYLNSMKDTTVIDKSEIMGVVPIDWESIPATYLVTYVYKLQYNGVSGEPIPYELSEKINENRYNKNYPQANVFVKQAFTGASASIGLIEVTITHTVTNTTFDVHTGGVNLDHHTALIESWNKTFVDALIVDMDKIIHFSTDNYNGVYLVNFTRYIKFIRRSTKLEEVYTDSLGKPEFTRQAIQEEDGTTLIADTYDEPNETRVFKLEVDEPELWDVELEADYSLDEDKEPDQPFDFAKYFEIDNTLKLEQPTIENEFEDTESKPEPKPEAISVPTKQIAVDILGNEYSVESIQEEYAKPDIEEARFYDKPAIKEAELYDTSRIEEYEQIEEAQPKKKSFGEAFGDAMKKIGAFIFRR